MPNYNYDIVSDSVVQSTYGLFGNQLTKIINRVIRVSGVSPTGSGTGLTSDVPTACVNYVKALIPVLTASPLDSACLARGYSFTPDPGQTDGGLVTVSYQFQLGTFVSESNGGLQTINTDAEFYTSGSSTRTPILVPWISNQFIGTAGGSVTANGVTITLPSTGIYYIKQDGTPSTSSGDANATLYVNADAPYNAPTYGYGITQVVSPTTYNEIIGTTGTVGVKAQYLGFVNNETFEAVGGDSTNDAPYMWLCDGINGSADYFTETYTISLHFTWRYRGWKEYIRGDVVPPDANNFWFYDQTGSINPNGFYAAKVYQDCDLDTLCGLL